jgi:hypothetical protein
MNKKLLLLVLILTGFISFGQIHRHAIANRIYTNLRIPKQASHLVRKNGAAQVMSSACDTLNIAAASTWTSTEYEIDSTSGFLFGTSVLGNLQEAQYFDASSSSGSIVMGCGIGLVYSHSADPTKIVPINIYANDGVNGSPGTLLGTQNLTMGQIMANSTTDYYSIISFSNGINLSTSKQFYVSIDISNLSWPQDSLAIVTNQDGQSVPGTTWDQFPDSTWHAQSDSTDWSLNISGYIFPYLSNTPVSPVSFTQDLSTVCQGGSIHFNSGASMPFNLSFWDFGVGNTPDSTTTLGTDTNITGTFYTVGTYSLTLYTYSGGCNQLDSAKVGITVNPLPTVNYTLTQDSLPQTWDAYPVYSSNIALVVWYWGDGTSTSGLYPSHSYSLASKYTICVTANDTEGCTATYCLNDSLYRSTNSNMIMIYALNSNNTANIQQLTSANNQTTIYPNPANNSITIETSTTGKQTLQVYDVNGKLILSQNINEKATIDVSSLNDGIFTISIVSNEGVVNKKLVIVK